MNIIRVQLVDNAPDVGDGPVEIARYEVATHRGGPAKIQEVRLPRDHTIEVELENGLVLFRQVHGLVAQDASRSAASRDVFDLPEAIRLDPATRGLGDLAVRAYRFFSGAGMAEAAVRAAARKLEEQTESEGRDQLFRLPREGGFVPLEADFQEGRGRPMLVLIHGTASHTLGAFGPLVRLSADAGVVQPGSTATKHWNALADFFTEDGCSEPDIYAFEHATLTRSPIQNAIALLDQLPKGAELHLMSHSRGGLIGELLALGPGGLTSEDFDILGSDDTQVRGELEYLQQKLSEKQIKVARFVRVAAPMSGTLLNSDRLDRTLTIFFNTLSLIPGGHRLLIGPLRKLVRAVVATRNRIDLLPGLEAMSPDSALVAVLNRKRTPLDSRLSVVAGDIAPKGIFRTLAVLASDLFYREDHDLIVNTRAMFAGAPRADAVSSFMDEGAEVNHFSYWRNRTTLDQIFGFLTKDVSVDDTFKDDSAPPGDASDSVARAIPVPQADARKPLVFLLPGIMGTHLRPEASDDRVWINIPRLLTGKFHLIGTDQDGGLRPAAPDGVIRRYYRKLARHLEKSRDVVIFEYDWRKSIVAEAARLAQRMEVELGRRSGEARKSVRIVAHSMGGLVARAMINARRDLWGHMRADGGPGASLVMLGTPNRGSMSIVWSLLGRDRMMRMLDRLDRRHGMDELVRQIVPMPGVLELLPNDKEGTYFEQALWARLADKVGPNWPTPDKAHLSEARKALGALTLKGEDAPHMSYIAGKADMTPSGIDPETLQMTGSPHGDGRVLWRTGLLPGVATWYAPNTSHGDLPRDEALFGAIVDLLQTGATNALPQNPPRSRGGEALFPVEPADVLFPDEDDLAAAVMCADDKPGQTAKRPEKHQVASIQIVHGDLRMHPYVITVGHFEDAPLLSAERAIDRQLDGQLTRYRALGLYPGKQSSSELFLSGHNASLCEVGGKGALVVGLGPYGKLSPNGLVATLTQAFMAYALRTGPKIGKDGNKTLSTLLVGSRDILISVNESVEAIVAALVAANNRLPEAHHIDSLTIVELYEDTAIEAGLAMQRIVEDGRWNESVTIRPELQLGLAGRKRVRTRQGADWHHEIQIQSVNRKCGKAFAFTGLNAAARLDQRAVHINKQHLDRIIAKAVENTAHHADLGKLLFEWTVPPSMKSSLSNGSDLTLKLDKEAACYPWELLHDNWSRDSDPIATNAAVIRQLITDGPSTIHRVAASGRALIIGDPVSFFSPLEGARREALAAGTLLEQRGWQGPIELQVRSDVDLERALTLEENQLLHFAGHGVHNWGPDKLTGLITGQNNVLNPRFVDRLRYVPQFVFLNCCYGGAITAADIAPEQMTAGTNPAMPQAARDGRPELAANVAVKFIEAGSLAVIAAGWEVNDAAAELFAHTFYQAFLGGTSFGEAVTLARRKVIDIHPSSDTWGAYQCYGDPQFRLHRAGTAVLRAHKEPTFVAPGQATLALQSLLLDARFAETPQETSAVRNDLRGIMKCLQAHSKWGSDPELYEAVADIFSELGDHAGAISYYERAVRRSPPKLSVNALENLVKLRVRAATFKRREAGEDADAGLFRNEQDEIAKAIKNLQTHQDISPGRGAALRQSRIGDCYLRLAASYASQRGSSAERATETMKTSLNAYKKAGQIAAHIPEYDTAHIRIRHAFCGYVLSKRNAKGKITLAAVLALVQRAITDVEDASSLLPSFENRRLIAEARLFELVSNPDAGREVEEEMLQVFGRLFMTGGSVGRRLEVISDLGTVAELLIWVSAATRPAGETVAAISSELEKTVLRI